LTRSKENVKIGNLVLFIHTIMEKSKTLNILSNYFLLQLNSVCANLNLASLNIEISSLKSNIHVFLEENGYFETGGYAIDAGGKHLMIKFSKSFESVASKPSVLEGMDDLTIIDEISSGSFQVSESLQATENVGMLNLIENLFDALHKSEEFAET
jgi:hypothetical protein